MPWRVPCRPLLAGVALTLIGSFCYWAPAASAAGTPQVPQPGQVVFEEGFENGTGPQPTLVTDYVGADGTRYVADPAWLTNCNGWILSFNTPFSALNETTCPDTVSGGAPDPQGWGLLRQMAWVLGRVDGESADAAQSNHAVTAYTDGGAGTPPPDAVQFATADTSAIHLPTPNEFITFSVNAAEVNCVTSVGDPTTNPPTPPKAGHAPSQYEFYLTSPNLSNPQPTFVNPIEPCTDPRATLFEPASLPTPDLGSAPGQFSPLEIKAGVFPSDAAVLFTHQNMGFELFNTAGTGLGNDAAFDHIRVLNATPALDKSFDPAAVDVGGISKLTYTITNTAELGVKDGWSFTDTLPAGLVVAGTGNGDGSSTCANTSIVSPGGGNTIAVTGDLPQISGSAPAQTVPYCTVTIDVTSNQAGIYTNGPANVTTVGLSAPDPASVKFGQVADLLIAKTGAPNPAVPGHDIQFTLHVRNLGPDQAQNVVVSDPVPAQLTFASGTPGCTLTGGIVRCALGTINSGAGRDLTLVFHVDSSATNGVVNVATVSSTTTDPNLNNNSANVLILLGPQADLQIEKHASSAAVAPGGQVMYTLAVHNNGPSDATGVTVSDPLPRGLTVESAQPSQGSCQTTTAVVCRIGRVVSGGEAQVLVTAKVAETATGVLSNTATVADGQPDPTPANNSSTATVHVLRVPATSLPSPPHLVPEVDVSQHVLDVAITKHVDRRVAYPGQRLTFTLHLTNRSLLRADNVRVTDTSNVPLRLISAHSSRGSCRLSRPLRCILGDMAFRAHATITVVAEATAAGRLRNTATVTSGAHDSDPSNNIASANVDIRPILRLSKRASPHIVNAGQDVTYHLTVTNPTTVTIHRVTVCDSLPDGLTFHSASPRAHVSMGRRCWSIARLAAGESSNLTLVSQTAIDRAGTLRNVATATAPGVGAVHARASVIVRPMPPPPGVTG